MAVIQLRNVSKTYPNGKKVIENLSLDIPERSFTVLLGPSGCGKTTALRMIAGLEEVSGGEIYIGEKNVTKTEPGDRGLAMVFQNYAIYPHMSIRKNIEFGLKNQKMPKNEIDQRVDHVVQMVGLQDYLHAKPSMLSGGQRQRVALARAISKQPQVFLMDEPLSNLDAKLRNQMRGELIELHHKLQSTFVFVTHDQIEAMTMATNIVVFNEGLVMQQGTSKEVYDNPANLFVATFIGDPGMNIVRLPEVGVVGFRPQKVKFSTSEKLKGIIAPGIVVTKEMLGYEYLYHVETGLGRIVIKSTDDFNLGSQVHANVAEGDLYFFDLNGQRTSEEGLIQSIIDKLACMEGVNATREEVIGVMNG